MKKLVGLENGCGQNWQVCPEDCHPGNENVFVYTLYSFACLQPSPLFHPCQLPWFLLLLLPSGDFQREELGHVLLFHHIIQQQFYHLPFLPDKERGLRLCEFDLEVGLYRIHLPGRVTRKQQWGNPMYLQFPRKGNDSFMEDGFYDLQNHQFWILGMTKFIQKLILGIDLDLT